VMGVDPSFGTPSDGLRPDRRRRSARSAIAALVRNNRHHAKLSIKYAWTPQLVARDGVTFGELSFWNSGTADTVGIRAVLKDDGGQLGTWEVLNHGDVTSVMVPLTSHEWGETHTGHVGMVVPRSLAGTERKLSRTTVLISIPGMRTKNCVPRGSRGKTTAASTSV